MGKKTAKRQMRYYAGMALQLPHEMMARRQAAEESLSMLRSSLGTGVAPGQEGAGGGSIFGGDYGISPQAKNLVYAGQAEGLRGLTGKALDPAAIARRAFESPEGQIADVEMKRALSFAKREGPEWEALQKTTAGAIIEGGQARLRDELEQLRRESARGGARASRARQGMTKMRHMEQINLGVRNQVAVANRQNEQWASQYATTTTDWAANWASNVAGIRESFHANLDKQGELMARVSIPTSMEATQAANVLSMQIHADNRAKAKRTYQMAISAAAMFAGAGAGAMGGGGFAGALTGATTGIGGMGMEGLLGGLFGGEAAGGMMGTLTGSLERSGFTGSGTAGATNQWQLQGPIFGGGGGG